MQTLPFFRLMLELLYVVYEGVKMLGLDKETAMDEGVFKIKKKKKRLPLCQNKCHFKY